MTEMVLPREVEPIKSTRDIKRIKQYLLGKPNKRDYIMFVIGVNTGLRIGDLLSLQIGDILEEGGTIKKAVYIQEQKTGYHSSLHRPDPRSYH